MSNPLVVVAGPTASGKSALGMEIAKKYDGEIICADSRTVYKGMDIGTAKPSLADQKEVRHYLLDVISPNQTFTAADFKKLAVKAINDISGRGKLPIMVGGTGLYIDAVLFDYQFGQIADISHRAALQGMTVEALQQLCRDNEVSLPINDKNKRHLIRAIELGGLLKQPKMFRPNTIVVALTTDREILRSRVTKRANEMVKQNVLAEVKQIGERYGWHGEALTSNVYRILRPVVSGEMDLAQAFNLLITSDMQLAKRQVTWLKRNPYIIWGETPQLMAAVEHFVQQNKRGESMPLQP